jgi:hypothetical protein
MMHKIERGGRNTQVIILSLEDTIDLIASLGEGIKLRRIRAENRRDRKRQPHRDDSTYRQVAFFSNKKPERMVAICIADEGHDPVEQEAPDDR